MHPRVVIVGTVPYNKNYSSRAFDAYFHNWEKENLAQIFSNPNKPLKGHCGTLFQITDYRMAKRWIKNNNDPGEIYLYDDLEDIDCEMDENTSQLISGAYKMGGKHTPMIRILRGILWKKSFWCTKKLNDWLENFKPECVFLAFSDDYFIPQIALYIANKFDIPIVSCIGDDYYFNVRFSINPFYYIYKLTYRSLIRNVLAHRGSAIYISNKIRDKYNEEFGLNGQTVYLTSEIARKEFGTINVENPVITYFGNIRMGRNKSLYDIGTALGQINPSYRIEVYANEVDEAYYKIFESNPNIIYKGKVPYSQVKKRMSESDITIIVEGFLEKDISLSRYSLSTKAADTLASGSMILTYGSSECGIIEYMKSTNASIVCCEKASLKDSIEKLLYNTELQKELYENQINVSKLNHNLERSCAVSVDVISSAIQLYKEGKKDGKRS